MLYCRSQLVPDLASKQSPRQRRALLPPPGLLRKIRHEGPHGSGFVAALVAHISALIADMLSLAEPTDYTALWNDLREATTTLKFKQRAAGQGSFNHIAGGYDAGYYG